jgi:hypothetical protein
MQDVRGPDTRGHRDRRHDLSKISDDFDRRDLRHGLGNAREPQRGSPDLKRLSIQVHRSRDVGLFDPRRGAEVDAYDRVSVDNVGPGVAKTVIVEKAPFGELQQRGNVE